MSIIDNILLEAQKRNLNDQDLCKILNTHKSKIYDWKKGRSEPTAENILSIAQHFNISTDFLLTGKDNIKNIVRDGNNVQIAETKKEPSSKERLAQDIETILLDMGIIKKDTPMTQEEKNAFFYEHLIKLCDEKGVKLTPLVNSLGLSKENIEKWRNGTSPTGETLAKFANFFGISTNLLLTEKKENNFYYINNERMNGNLNKRMIEYDIVKNGLYAYFEGEDRYIVRKGIAEYDKNDEKLDSLSNKTEIPRERISRFITIAFSKSGVTENDYPNVAEFVNMMFIDKCIKEASVKLLERLKEEFEAIKINKEYNDFVLGKKKEIRPSDEQMSEAVKFFPNDSDLKTSKDI